MDDSVEDEATCINFINRIFDYPRQNNYFFITDYEKIDLFIKTARKILKSEEFRIINNRVVSQHSIPCVVSFSQDKKSGFNIPRIDELLNYSWTYSYVRSLNN